MTSLCVIDSGVGRASLVSALAWVFCQAQLGLHCPLVFSLSSSDGVFCSLHRDEAEMEYLKIAQDLEMYGVNYFAIRVC